MRKINYPARSEQLPISLHRLVRFTSHWGGPAGEVNARTYYVRSWEFPCLQTPAKYGALTASGWNGLTIWSWFIRSFAGTEKVLVIFFSKEGNMTPPTMEVCSRYTTQTDYCISFCKVPEQAFGTNIHDMSTLVVLSYFFTRLAVRISAKRGQSMINMMYFSHRISFHGDQPIKWGQS